jgi:hypothetical protein
VLQKNVKLFGPMNAMVEGSSCWNSDASEEEKLFLVDFGRAVEIHELRLEFQAGFAAEVCGVQLLVRRRGPQGDNDDEEWTGVDELEPKDTHELQSFILKCSVGTALKLIFDEFKDFYGRVTLYRIEVWGRELN